MRRLAALALVVVTLLGAGPAARADDAGRRVIEVRPGASQIIPVGPIEDFVVLSQHDIDVAQVSGDEISALVLRPGGRALVLVRTPDGYQTWELRAQAAEAPLRAPQEGPASPYAPVVALGGAYGLAGAGGAPAFNMEHWAGWSQQADTFGLDAFVSVSRNPSGQFAVPSARLEAETARWSATLGDFDLPLTRGAQVHSGSSALLRGAEFSVLPTSAPVRLGVLVGAYRAPMCCNYFDPGALSLGAATVSWRPKGGAWVDALGGAYIQEGEVAPVARLQGGYGGDGGLFEISVAQSGPGTSGSTNAYVRLAPKLSWFASGAGAFGGYRDLMTPRTQPPAWGATTGVAWRDGQKASVEAAFYGGMRAAEGVSPSLQQFGGRLDAGWRPVAALGLRAGYQRTYVGIDGSGVDEDTLSAGTSVNPVQGLTLDSGVRVSLPRDGSPNLLVSAAAGYAFTATTGLRAGWSWSDRPSAETEYQAAVLGAYADGRVASFLFDATFQRTTREQVTLTVVGAAASASFRVRRFLELGVGGYASKSIDPGPLGWGSMVSWTFTPSALPRSAGGLGLRGSVTGDVFLDDNHNGVRDEGEKGLPGMSVVLGDAREVTTDEDGRFTLPNLPTGEYPLRFDRGGYHALGPTQRTIEVTPLRRTHESLGLTWGSSINGLLYVDVHEDEKFDNGDPGVAAEYITLRNEKGIVVQTVAAPSGRFTFDGLPPGVYTVEVDPFGLPGGYRPLDSLDQEVLVDEGRTYQVHIRLDPARAIGGIVWEDQDRDGRGDGKRDIGIGGAEVYLSTGEIVRTGPDGSFLFRDLAPGAYAVRTELGTEAKVVVLPVEPKEVLDLAFVLPRGTRPPAPSVRTAPKPPDSVAGLVLEAPMTVLPQGVELQVTATAVLSNGETREVTTRANWQSSDTSILSVSPEGVVRGTAAGTAGVTAEWKGGVGDPLAFEVLGLLDRVTVSPVGLRLNPGNTADLRVDVVDRSGRGGLVTPVAVWSVADPRVARVDSAGRLKALKDGVTTVQARIGEVWSPPLEVQVITAAVTALSIENLPARMPEGATVQLKATGYDTRLEVQNVTESVTWASSDPAVVRVEPDGRIIAVGRGTAQITASIGSLFTRSRTVFVTNTPPLALEVIPPGMTLSMYDLQKFRVNATFEDGSKGAVTTVVEWIVEGTAAMVRPDGVVVPREPGTCTIKARYLGVESNAVTVTVEAR